MHKLYLAGFAKTLPLGFRLKPAVARLQSQCGRLKPTGVSVKASTSTAGGEGSVWTLIL